MIICYTDNNGVGAHYGTTLLCMLQVSLQEVECVCMRDDCLLVHDSVCVCACVQEHLYTSCVSFCVIVCVCDDPDILVFWLMRCEDECCCRRNAAKKMAIITVMIGITLREEVCVCILMADG